MGEDFILQADKVGVLIKKFRTQQNISPKELCRGLCTFIFLNKIEE